MRAGLHTRRRVAVAASRHCHAVRADQRVAAQELLVGTADELTAAIGVQDHVRAARPLPHRHLDGTHDHVAIVPVMHGAARHQLAVEIDHDA